MITGNSAKMGLAETHNFLTSSTGHSKKLKMIASSVFCYDKINVIEPHRFDINSQHI
jgi:hypothetical protein